MENENETKKINCVTIGNDISSQFYSMWNG